MRVRRQTTLYPPIVVPVLDGGQHQIIGGLQAAVNASVVLTVVFVTGEGGFVAVGATSFRRLVGIFQIVVVSRLLRGVAGVVSGLVRRVAYVFG